MICVLLPFKNTLNNTHFCLNKKQSKSFKFDLLKMFSFYFCSDNVDRRCVKSKYFATMVVEEEMTTFYCFDLNSFSFPFDGRSSASASLVVLQSQQLGPDAFYSRARVLAFEVTKLGFFMFEARAKSAKVPLPQCFRKRPSF
jgi:hypothetical protein